MEQDIKYPIGEQDFKNLRERECLYIDKTKYIKKIVESGGKYYFLARPRRFGKSLFLSTLQYFFEGRRELFNGLYIGSTNWEWASYPVLRLDLNTDRYADTEQLEAVLDNMFGRWEELYGVETISPSYSQRFNSIICKAHEKTGRQVVILVDEYDKPLVGNLNRNDNFDHYRNQLASIYSNFKSSAEHIRLVFLTGVSRFSKLSVFSDLNNLNDITFDNSFADICGITEEEMLSTMRQGIEQLAQKNSISFKEACRQLKKTYDGYRFAIEGSDIYNPWSLLNCMNSKDIAYYWNHTGKPTIIAESLKRINADLEKTFNSYTTMDELKGLDLLSPNPRALLFQTGYLTIKNYNPKIRRVKLGIPNDEVKAGLFKDLLPYYVKCKTQTENETISNMVMHFMLGEPDEAIKCLQAYFAGISFKLRMNNENNFHNAFFLMMDIVGLETEAESTTSDGSIDITIKTDDYIYVIELKYDGTAEDALRQIEEKRYARKYQTDSRQVVEIGVNFSSKTRCIEDWKITTTI